MTSMTVRDSSGAVRLLMVVFFKFFFFFKVSSWDLLRGGQDWFHVGTLF